MAYEKEKEKSPTHPAAQVVHAAKPKAATPEAEPEPVPAPLITSLAPASAAVGDPSFGLHVLGAGFHPTAVIVFAGNDEPTTFFTEGDLVTGMNMAVWLGADALSCQVRNPDGQVSNTVPFDLQPPRAVPLDPAGPSKPFPAVDLI